MTTQGQSTRKERREQARQERLARETAERERKQRMRRVWQLGAALALAVVIVVVAVVISSSSSGPTGLQKGHQANSLVSKVNSSIGGIPQSGNTLGNPSAPLSMQYFGDLQCPVCRQFTIAELPQVIQSYVRTGKMSLQYRSLETATPDTTTFVNQQVAALAAGKQNKMWQYVELFYNEQGQEGTGYVTESFLSGLASQIPGLGLSKWRADRGDNALVNQVSSDVQTANQSSYHYTPTLVIHGPRGTKVEQGLAPASTITQDIKAVS